MTRQEYIEVRRSADLSALFYYLYSEYVAKYLQYNLDFNLFKVLLAKWFTQVLQVDVYLYLDLKYEVTRLYYNNQLIGIY